MVGEEWNIAIINWDECFPKGSYYPAGCHGKGMRMKINQVVYDCIYQLSDRDPNVYGGRVIGRSLRWCNEAERIAVEFRVVMHEHITFKCRLDKVEALEGTKYEGTFVTEARSMGHFVQHKV